MKMKGHELYEAQHAGPMKIKTIKDLQQKINSRIKCPVPSQDMTLR